MQSASVGEATSMHHVAIAIRNLDSSINFYRHFGFEIEDSCSLDDGKLTLTVLFGPHGRLELFSSNNSADARLAMGECPSRSSPSFRRDLRFGQRDLNFANLPSRSISGSIIRPYRVAGSSSTVSLRDR